MAVPDITKLDKRKLKYLQKFLLEEEKYIIFNNCYHHMLKVRPSWGSLRFNFPQLFDRTFEYSIFVSNKNEMLHINWQSVDRNWRTLCRMKGITD